MEASDGPTLWHLYIVLGTFGTALAAWGLIRFVTTVDRYQERTDARMDALEDRVLGLEYLNGATLHLHKRKADPTA